MEINYKSLSEQELLDIRDDAFKELERRQAVKNTKKQIEELVTLYTEITKDEIPLETIPSDGVAPGQRIKGRDGHIYYNDTTTWLPVGPELYLTGYRREDPVKVESAQPWRSGVYVNVGDICRYKNEVYGAVQTHETQKGSEPDTSPALWTLI